MSSSLEHKIWSTENGIINRHTTVPKEEILSKDIMTKHYKMIKVITIFQQYIKSVIAEFIATWMLVFWACMQQPGVSA